MTAQDLIKQLEKDPSAEVFLVDQEGVVSPIRFYLRQPKDQEDGSWGVDSHFLFSTTPKQHKVD